MSMALSQKPRTWYFILHNTEVIYCTSRTEYRISLTEDALDDPAELRKNVKRVLGVIVGLLKDRVIDHELEAKKTDEKAKLEELEIAKEILKEEPIIEYHPPFLDGLELDAFFQKYRIALEVQGAQHRLHSTSWYKDAKKLEDIVDREMHLFG
ncbi:hypothetical protein RclHR1_18270002 [Rhizophagus clarus]|uniref:Uncharacterized protein n=1 Tax=Rhizophagus clarus TaxID=94130 RepID=A0A2Z6RF62_9GLOM|nr:hypothetical protein RclHR1_18270002 [Rhizophagus clarus]